MRWARSKIAWQVLRRKVLVLYSSDHPGVGGKLHTYGCQRHEVVALLRRMAQDIEDQSRPPVEVA